MSSKRKAPSADDPQPSSRRRRVDEPTELASVRSNASSVSRREKQNEYARHRHYRDPRTAPNGQVSYTHESSGVEMKIENVVMTVELNCPLNLMEIAVRARNAEYNPERFNAVVMRIREPKCTALVFASGKMVVTGCKSETDCETAARQFAVIIKKVGFDIEYKHAKLSNLVGVCDCGFPISLEQLALQHSKFATYEPELFPGLIYRMVQPKVTFIAFVSGKVVLTGARYQADLFDAFEKMFPVFYAFSKNVTLTNE